jgi:glycine hydroxymethyltransferase
MREDEMEKIAEFIRRVIVDKEDPSQVKEDVKKLAGEFQEIKYCFT